jgi:hypothetical protein
MNQALRVYIYMHCQLKTQVFTGCVWAPAVIKSGRVRWSLNVADTGKEIHILSLVKKLRKAFTWNDYAKKGK